MKKTFFTMMVIASMAIVLGKLSNREKVVDYLLLENVEALAAGEEVHPIRCAGFGNTYCPQMGKNVAYIGYIYSLE